MERIDLKLKVGDKAGVCLTINNVCSELVDTTLVSEAREFCEQVVASCVGLDDPRGIIMAFDNYGYYLEKLRDNCKGALAQYEDALKELDGLDRVPAGLVAYEEQILSDIERARKCAQ